jgi:hypothetical protein
MSHRQASVAKFKEKVCINDLTNCWEWTGRKKDGINVFSEYYGDASHNAKMWIYKKMVGEIECSRFLIPTCKNKNCVNPEHMIQVNLSNWKKYMRSVI